MKDKWGKVATGILSAIVVLIIIPLIVAVVTTAHVIDVNTESQWIGFAGNYLGALIGGAISGGITMYVLFRTLKDNRQTLDETLANENRIQKHNEIIDFCNLITMRCSDFFVDLEETCYKASDYTNSEYKLEEMREFTECNRLTKSTLLGLIVQIEVVKEKEDYIPTVANELYLKLKKMYAEMNNYYAKVLDKEQNVLNRSEEIMLLGNDIILSCKEYQKCLLEKD